MAIQTHDIDMAWCSVCWLRGDVQGVMNARLDELCEIPGISDKTAGDIFATFRGPIPRGFRHNRM